MRCSYGAFLSHTGHTHVGFFSFIWIYSVASKHWRWEHVNARHAIVSLIFPSLKKTQTTTTKNIHTLNYIIHCVLLRVGMCIGSLKIRVVQHTGHRRDTRRLVVAISLSGSAVNFSLTVMRIRKVQRWTERGKHEDKLICSTAVRTRQRDFSCMKTFFQHCDTRKHLISS